MWGRACQAHWCPRYLHRGPFWEPMTSLPGGCGHECTWCGRWASVSRTGTLPTLAAESQVFEKAKQRLWSVPPPPPRHTPKKLRTFQASTLPLKHTPKPLKRFNSEVVPDYVAQAGSSYCGILSVAIPGMCHHSQLQSAFNLSDTLKSKADSI